MNIFILLLFLTLVITPIMNWAQDVYKMIYTDKFQTLQSISAASEVRVGKWASQRPRVHHKYIHQSQCGLHCSSLPDCHSFKLSGDGACLLGSFQTISPTPEGAETCFQDFRGVLGPFSGKIV